MDLTIIIPIVKWDEQVKEQLDRALDSVALQTVRPKNIVFSSLPLDNEEYNIYLKKTIEEFKNFDIVVSGVQSPDGSTVPDLINNGVNKTKYFTILEPSDMFEKTWFENVERYMSHDQDISMYLPIVKMFTPDGQFIRFYNEAYWANGFTDDLGYVSEEALKTMFDMNITGSIINTQDFKDVGGLKTNIKLYYWYEFMLRFVYNKKNAFVIPKSLYNHIYVKPTDITEKEAKFYWDASLQEYYYKNQRDLEYTE